MESRRIQKLLQTTVLAGVFAMISFQGDQVLAQENDTIVVTGSRIPRKDLDSVSPLTVVDNEEFKLQGAVRTEDLTNSLPQVLASQGTSYSNGATGTASLDIRGLGAVRTLTLVNGRRMAPGSPSSESVDLNQIPSSLVKSVEIITGGASAVYGADAVGGVANFIIDDEFTGFRIDANYSFYQHNNKGGNPSAAQTALRAKNNPTQFSLPKSNVLDGQAKDITLSFGANLDDKKGHVSAYIGYKHESALKQSERDYSTCALGYNATSKKYRCGGSSTSYPGRFADFGSAPTDGFSVTIDPTTGNTFIPFTPDHQYNYAPGNYYQRPGERWTAGFFGQYQINDNVEVYTEMQYMDYFTVAQIAPSGFFGFTTKLNCDNPLMSADQYKVICTNNGFDNQLNADGTPDRAPAYYLRRNVEGGNRQDHLTHTNVRAVFGIRGNLTDNITYDVFANNSRVSYAQNYINEIHKTRGRRALDAVRNADGDIVCRSVVDGTDPSCVVYNPYTIGKVTQEALNYIKGSGFTAGSTELNQVQAVLVGDTTYNLPTSDETIAYVVGMEYRSTFVERRADDNFSQNLLAGQGGATNDIKGYYELYELFGEARIPLLSGKFFAEEVALELGYRHSDYSLGYATDTYKVGMEWAVNDEFKFRASTQHAVRAPTINELYLPQRLGLWDSEYADSIDPCGGKSPLYTAEQCARTGVTAAQYGKISSNSAGQYNQLVGGNSALNPEASDTLTFGVVWSPEYINGLNVQLDYFNIKIEDAISTVSASTSLKKCAEGNIQKFCDLIHRGSVTGSLWLGTDTSPTSGYILATNINIGSEELSGVDLNIDYGFDVLDKGRINISVLGTYLDSYKVVELPGEKAVECVKIYAGTCGRPRPAWKHKARFTYSPNEGKYQASLAWRYIGQASDSAKNEPLDARNYLDLSGSYNFNDDMSVVVGVNNVLDSDPPLSAIVGAGSGNGNTYPQIYDALGRYVHMSVRLDF